MDAKTFIDKVASGSANEAKDLINDLLSSRAFETLEVKKIEIAQSLYNDGEEIEVQDTADTPMEDELLTQEEFEELSDEDQELYLEAFDQLNELLMHENIEINEDTMTHITLKKAPGTEGKVTHVHYKGEKIGSITKLMPTGKTQNVRTGKIGRATLGGYPGEFATQYKSSDGHVWNKKDHAVQSVRDAHSDKLVYKRQMAK